MRSFVSVSEMQAIDESVIRTHPHGSFGLMKDVAQEAFDVLSQHERFVSPVLILCGPGNNGGDGYCLAELLRLARTEVCVLEVMKPQSEDAQRASRLYKGKRLKNDWRQVKPKTIVDAVFGLKGYKDLNRECQRLFDGVNRSSAFKVAMDISSGVSLIKEQCGASAFRADLTLAVGYPKLPMLKPSVAELLGEVVVLKRAFKSLGSSQVQMLEPEDFGLFDIKRVSHKGDFGRAAIVGGSTSMPGAAMLAAEAAARVGAGYSTLFFAKRGGLSLRIKEASFIFKQRWTLDDLRKQSSWVLGCGGVPNIKWNFNQWAEPVVLDADVFSQWKAGEWKKLARSKARCVLTPHAGEAAHLLKWKRSEVEKHPQEACEELVKLSGQSVYLKGAPGFLRFAASALKGQHVWKSNMTYVNLSVNPVFARAGSGDILSGILGGFLAQRPDSFVEMVVSGLVFQNQMGEILRSSRGLISSDQLNVFKRCFDRLAKVRR